MKRLSTGLLLTLVCLGSNGIAQAQTTFTWGTNAGTAWATGSNWSGGVRAGSSTDPLNNDIAEWGAGSTGTQIQMNFNAAPAQLGTPLYVGTLNILSTNTVAKTMGANTGVAGIVQLNGTGANKLILSNASTSLFTLAPLAGGSGTGMSLQLSATNSEIAVTNTGGITISANIAGTGTNGITKTGTGILTLSGTNTYTGGTAVNGGLLVFATTAALPTTGAIAVNTGSVGVNLGGTGEFTSATSGAGSLGGLISGTTFSAGTALVVNTANATADQTYSGLLTGPDVSNPLGFSKVGAGSLTLNNSSNNARLTGSQVGTLAIPIGTYSFDGTATTGYYVGRASTVAQTAAASRPTLTLGVTGVSSATLSAGTQDLRVAFNDTGTFTGSPVASITAVVNVNNASSLTVNNLLLTYAYANISPVYNATLNVNDIATVTVNGRFDIGMNLLFKDNNANINATANLNGGTVTVTGATTVNANLGSAASGPATLKVAGGSLTTDQVLIRSRRSAAVATFEIVSGSVTATNGVLIDRTVSLTQNTRINLLGGTLYTSSISTTGAGQTAPAVPWAGTGSSTDGTLTLNGGTVVALGNNPTFITGFNTTIPTIGTSGITFNSGVFSIGIPQALTGTGGTLNKTGAGTLTLSGANTYTGLTTVSVGTLLANRQTSGSSTGTGNISIESGATLGGNGRVGAVSPQVITVKSGGILTAGTGVGATTLQALGNVTFDPGSSFKATLFGATDISLLNAASVSTPSNALLRLDLSGLDQTAVDSLRAGGPTTYTVVSSTAAITGIFGGIDTTSNSNFGLFQSSEWSLTPSPTSNTLQVDFTPVPEPGTILGLAALGFGVARRFRRK